MRVSPSRFELALVVVISLAGLAPGLWRYSPVDPWETHYGEVGRMMRQTHDYVVTRWPGTNFDGSPNEGFRSKPVLVAWLIAAGMHATGLAADGGYSGEMVHDARTMIALRLPFVLCAVGGLAMLWWMLACLVSRRVAWLALLVVGSSPMFCLIARQAIPDMPLTACVMGAVSLLVMAIEDGDRPCAPIGRLAGRAIDARHVVLGLAGALVVVQAAYYAYYFTVSPQLAVPAGLPEIWLPVAMLVLLAAQSRTGWLILRLPFVVIGGIIAAIVDAPMPPRGASITAVLTAWERWAPDRYLVRAILYPFALLAPAAGRRRAWSATLAISDRLLAMAPLTTMRQLYLLGAYALLGLSILAKGPPGLAIAGGAGLCHVILRSDWRALYRGDFELKRGVLLLVAISVPWHVAMFLKDGPIFIGQYIVFNVLARATAGVDSSPGTFEMYTGQLGVGMWLWLALLPAALFAALATRGRSDDRAGRVRTLIAIWAAISFALFALVETKFHHYILPAVVPLGVLVAFWLDDLLARRVRLHPLCAALGIAIALLICRDLMDAPKRWIEMFVFRYDRPWPAGDPWQIDPSDGFLALGLAAAAAIALAARWRRLGGIALAGTGLAIGLWAMQVYMPLAGTHWGMREAMRAYYDQRTIYGEKLVYYGLGELYDDWHTAGDQLSFDTHIPQALQLGQPMTVTIEIQPAGKEQIATRELVLVAAVTAIGDHTISLQLAPGERAQLDPLLAGAARAPRGRPAIHDVDADHLVAWSLYWRGENFWSAEEIWGALPEHKATFLQNTNTELLGYLNDPARSPHGRRTFVITDATRTASLRGMLPSQRARDTFELVDTTSNKFSLVAFWQ